MNKVQKAIFPAFLVSGAFIIMFTRLIGNPQYVVFANASENTTPPIVEETPVVEVATADELPVVEVEAVEPVANEVSSECTLGSGFPDSIQQWCSIIQKHAANHGIDPNLIAAMMLQESGGNPDAYSHSGAVGLMQVMPRDGLAASFMCSGRPCFSSRPSMDELFEPEFNIEYGTRMLAGLIEKRGGVREALRSYGPMDVGYYYADLVLDIYNSNS